MTAAALNRSSFAPRIVGVFSLVAFFAVVEILIRSNLISRFIVPPPSEIVASFKRVIVEERVVTRFFQTMVECLTAGLMLTFFGVAGGVLLHRFDLLRRATETW
ncbi:MAG: ABC transporter permease, partial [Pseudolabrys sp.]|nr:ABC transporter permease [Pseudolabrys sp.]